MATCKRSSTNSATSCTTFSADSNNGPASAASAWNPILSKLHRRCSKSGFAPPRSWPSSLITTRPANLSPPTLYPPSPAPPATGTASATRLRTWPPHSGRPPKPSPLHLPPPLQNEPPVSRPPQSPPRPQPHVPSLPPASRDSHVGIVRAPRRILQRLLH